MNIHNTVHTPVIFSATPKEFNSQIRIACGKHGYINFQEGKFSKKFTLKNIESLPEEFFTMQICHGKTFMAECRVFNDKNVCRAVLAKTPTLILVNILTRAFCKNSTFILIREELSFRTKDED